MKSKIFIMAILNFAGLTTLCQQKKPTATKPKCATFVYNLTTGTSKLKDICYTVSLNDHIDMNQFRPGEKWDKTQDYWKYTITIEDNATRSKQSLNASFYLYEDSDEIKQYHCIIEDSEFKAVIFDKIRSCWLILMKQNDEFKILSCYSGYHFTNAFDIKKKTSSSISY
jgi:hypothetical protein